MTAPDLLTQSTQTEPVSSAEVPLDLSSKGVWQRQPNETLSSYAAFTTFLELGLDATLQQVADATSKKLTAILSLSARHHWMDRAAAWRAHVSHAYLADAQRERARQTELAQLRDRLLRQEMWEDHQTLRAFCREGLNQLRTDPANARVAGYEILAK